MRIVPILATILCSLSVEAQTLYCGQPATAAPCTATAGIMRWCLPAALSGATSYRGELRDADGFTSTVDFPASAAPGPVLVKAVLGMKNPVTFRYAGVNSTGIGAFSPAAKPNHVIRGAGDADGSRVLTGNDGPAYRKAFDPAFSAGCEPRGDY